MAELVQQRDLSFSSNDLLLTLRMVLDEAKNETGVARIDGKLSEITDRLDAVDVKYGLEIPDNGIALVKEARRVEYLLKIKNIGFKQKRKRKSVERLYSLQCLASFPAEDCL